MPGASQTQQRDSIDPVHATSHGAQLMRRPIRRYRETVAVV